MDIGHKYIVSEKHKFICYEIMKSCTGTLRGYFIINPAEKYEAFQISGKTKPQSIIDYENKKYFKFAFVRNPWARIVSCWLNKIYYYKIPGKPQATGIVHKELTPDTTFEEFVNFIYKTPDDIADCHFRSIHKSIPRKDIFIGKAESFDKDFKTIISTLGLTLHSIKRRNTTYDKNDTKPWKEYYTPDLVNKISERYKEDIMLYKYSFENG